MTQTPGIKRIILIFGLTAGALREQAIGSTTRLQQAESPTGRAIKEKNWYRYNNTCSSQGIYV